MIEPLGRQLLIEPDPQPKKVGAIVVPESAVDRGNSGVVLVRAPEAPVAFKPGIRVIFKPFTGTHFALAGRDLILMAPEDVLAILDGREPPPQEEVE